MKTALLASLMALVLALCAACGSELSEDDVLKKLSPSMVTIQFRGRDIGSGFLVEGNYIVSAAHVFWGLPGIDVVFEDGALHEDVPVAAYEYFADFAFLGPIDTPAPPVEFAEAESMTVEDTVFIVGNPSGPGGLSVTKGKFESVWHWPEADVVDVYSTAEGKPGMSGGANDQRQRQGHWRSLSGAGDRPELGILFGHHKRPTAKTGPRRGHHGSRVPQACPTSGKGSREHQFVLRDRWDTATFVSEGSNHSIEFDSYRRCGVRVFRYKRDWGLHTRIPHRPGRSNRPMLHNRSGVHRGETAVRYRTPRSDQESNSPGAARRLR